MRGSRTRLRGLVLTLSIAMLSTVMGATGAIAAETHVFDPTLSLTGGCGVSTLDPVPDPAEPPCPSPEPQCPTTPVGAHPPSGCFSSPAGIATDAYGNIYVASAGPEASLGAQGRIDIFDSSGYFITEVLDDSGPGSMAVDSKGNLYVANRFSEKMENVVRYSPTGTYDPEEGEIEYGDPPTVLVPQGFSSLMGLDVDRTNDRLFVKFSSHVTEYKSAEELNAEVGEFGNGMIEEEGLGIAVDAAHGIVYASTYEGPPGSKEKVVKAFELAAPHSFLFNIEDSLLPSGQFGTNMPLAVDEGTGHLFVYNGPAKKVYEFAIENEEATYLKSIEHGFQAIFGSVITVDNGVHSPNGAMNPLERYLYVPSNPSGVGHSYAFGPPSECEPVVEGVSFSNVTDTEAQLRAAIKPCGLITHYTFLYTSQAAFEAEGFAGAQTAGEGDLPPVMAGVDISAPATGLAPGTAYRFLVVATNTKGTDKGEASFATYPSAEPSSACPNDPFRTSFSALLPDCRAYELVTPSSTNARTPTGIGHLNTGTYFNSRAASPQGNAASFMLEGGSIPGEEAVGSLIGDPYLAERGEDGWSASYLGPSGFEATGMQAGGPSPDQGHYFWTTSGSGSAAINGELTRYMQYPDGHSALVGRGSLPATDPRAVGKLISEGAGHTLFTSKVKLEPNAPPDGTEAVYDRTSDEVTHVVSVLPGGGTPGQDAKYVSASLDGKGVAFRIGNVLYLRHDNIETYEIGENLTFAGVADGGDRIFYVKAGDLYRFDAQTGLTKPFTGAGNVVPVNVSADGSTAYFISKSVLTLEPNPRGAAPAAGQENLYRSREGTVSFVATVTKRDVEGEGVNELVGGLGLWVSVSEGKWGRASDPSRTTPGGNVLLFESRADLTGYDSDGKAEVYRYDSSAGTLECLSCNPTLASASGDASLQSISQASAEEEPFSSLGYTANLSLDGRRAFFQSPEALVPGDTDGLQDVYEWEASGAGSCTRPGGCIYLISSGHSAHPDFLWGVSDTGDDVFFRSPDILLARDHEETPSIYDARVNGGFAEPVEAACEGEGCRGDLTAPPGFPSPASGGGGPSGNVVKQKKCPKGKRKVRRHGKAVCVKKHRKAHRHKHHKASAHKKGAAK